MQKTSGRQTHTHLISINGTTHRLKGGCKRNVPLLFIMGILFKKKCVPLYLHSNKMTNSKHIGKSLKAPMNPEPHETRPRLNVAVCICHWKEMGLGHTSDSRKEFAAWMNEWTRRLLFQIMAPDRACALPVETEGDRKGRDPVSPSSGRLLKQRATWRAPSGASLWVCLTQCGFFTGRGRHGSRPLPHSQRLEPQPCGPLLSVCADWVVGRWHGAGGTSGVLTAPVKRSCHVPVTHVSSHTHVPPRPPSRCHKPVT